MFVFACVLVCVPACLPWLPAAPGAVAFCTPHPNSQNLMAAGHAAPVLPSLQEAKSLAKQQRHLQMEAEAARLEHREEHVSHPACLCCCCAALCHAFTRCLADSAVFTQPVPVMPPALQPTSHACPQHSDPNCAIGALLHCLQKMRVEVEQQLQLTQEQVMMLTNELNEAQVGAESFLRDFFLTRLLHLCVYGLAVQLQAVPAVSHTSRFFLPPPALLVCCACCRMPLTSCWPSLRRTCWLTLTA